MRQDFTALKLSVSVAACGMLIRATERDQLAVSAAGPRIAEFERWVCGLRLQRQARGRRLPGGCCKVSGQAMAVRKRRGAAAAAFVAPRAISPKSGGFGAEALARHGILGVSLGAVQRSTPGGRQGLSPDSRQCRPQERFSETCAIRPGLRAMRPVPRSQSGGTKHVGS
ncbi:MAG: hypothetical protein JNJ60_03100 [Rhodocyclaceae bacterium]|nr:hypothetical protein [Rhodocyclaceae bacterium]